MKFAVTQEIDWKAQESSDSLNEFVDKLAIKISKQDYGSGVEHFTIGFICMESNPYIEGMFKERKPRFKKIERVKLAQDNVLELHNTYGYDIKLNDDEVNNFISSTSKGLQIFCNKLVDSLSHLDSPSMKKRDFNSKLFRIDIMKFIDEINNA